MNIKAFPKENKVLEKNILEQINPNNESRYVNLYTDNEYDELNFGVFKKLFFKNKSEDEFNLFKKKYAMVMNGDGHERKRILQSNSSALLGLLMFYNVERNNLKININGTDITFDESYFEWKNPVYNRPSNMDIVLYSNESNVLLFVESKFLEYIRDVSIMSNKISSEYLNREYSKDIYNSIFDNNVYLKNIDTENNKDFTMSSLDNKYHYIDGIKQVISHTIGIINFIKSFKDKNLHNDYQNINKEINFNKFDDSTLVYFTEILYLNNEIKDNLSYVDFEKEYCKIMSIINNLIEKENFKSKFELLPIINYLEIYEKNISAINESVIEFYFSRKNK